MTIGEDRAQSAPDRRAILGIAPETDPLDREQACRRLGQERKGLLQVLAAEDLAPGQGGQGRLLREQALATGYEVRCGLGILACFFP